MEENLKSQKLMHIFTLFVLAVSFAWAILPMLVLKENYVFTIHDGLDSYAGIVQNIHDNHMYFCLNQAMPFMNGLNGMYTFITYNLYDFLNCMFGYLVGQTLTRIIGVVLGFASLHHLLQYIFRDRDSYQNDMICLLSVAYAITPVAPNRIIAFASLPLVLDIFIHLCKKEEVSKMALLGLLIPFLSIFDAVLVFVIGFWVLFTLALGVRRKRLNVNLCIAFILMCLSAVVVNINFMKVALVAEETNRDLAVETGFSFDFSLLKMYLLDGQYHSTALQRYVLLPFLLIGTIYMLCTPNRIKTIKFYMISKGILFGGWILWIISAFVETLQESGFKTGVLLIDGFQWGRVVGMMRIMWYLMFAAILFSTQINILWRLIMYAAICLQLVNIAFNPTVYNDTFRSVANAGNELINKELYTTITYKDFFSIDLYDKIKKDINYNAEGVAAYGFHPSVLLFNGFNTIDGYVSVHSMKWQLQFREIIAPALDRYEDSRNYYDEWGGRMYLFGELDYNPTEEKNVQPTPLYIDVEAFKKYEGKYILSRAPISNTQEIGLSFVKDYDSDESIYHIYLYEVK